MLMGNCVTDIYPLNGCLFLFSNRPLSVVGFSKIIIFAKNQNRAMIIPSGSSPEDIKIRKQIISDFTLSGMLSIQTKKSGINHFMLLFM